MTSLRLFLHRELMLAFVMAIHLLVGSLRAQDPAPVGIIDDCQFPSALAAQSAWKPMRGTPPVAVTNLAGRKALRLECEFTGTKSERASWDRAGTLDLSSCRGIQFELLCRDATPVSYFSVYFQSGEGWYHATFYPESSNDWNTIVLDKSAFGIEGQPAGWGKIRTLRLSAWRGQDRNTTLLVRDLRLTGALGRDALVGIVRGDSVAQESVAEARSVEQFTGIITEQLQDVGVGSAVLSDAEVTVERLLPARVVILPYNPRLPDRAADALVKYVERGGKLIAFYSLPEKLRGVLKVQGSQHVREPRPGFFASIQPLEKALPGAPTNALQSSWNINSVKPIPGASRVVAGWLDDRGQSTGHAAIIGSSNTLFMTHVLLADDADHKRRLLLAMVGALAPELWQQAAQASLARMGTLGGRKDFDETAAAITILATNKPRATQALALARAGRDAARRFSAERRFAEAIDQASLAGRYLLDAWCLAQSSQAGEFRAFWCHSAFGVQGMDWDEAIRRLAENGFTAILPNMLWGGTAYYDSSVLPVASEVAKRGDQIAQCVAACRKYGVQIHVWKVNWNLAHNAPREFVEKMRRAGRLQADVRGQTDNWLCPSHPENQQLEIAAMVEVARKYDVDGLHFDYIRYPDGDHCFCAGCRERFQRANNVTLRNWPDDVLADGPLQARWLDWRRSHITAVVRAVSGQARALKPAIKISAAVFPNWPRDRDSIGQDWKLWCERGWLDFVCPMDYTTSHRRFDNMVAQQIRWAGGVPCYPGIGESASSSRLGADGVIEQVQIARRLGTGGFVIFNYGAMEARELLPMLGLGITGRSPGH